MPPSWTTDFPQLTNTQEALSSLSSLTAARWLHAGQDIHIQWPVHMWLGTWQTKWRGKCLHSSISTWPHMQTCGCLFHPDVDGFTASAAHACWAYCIAHLCSTCSSLLEQYFVNPAHGKSQRISSTMKHYPEGINYSCKC